MNCKVDSSLRAFGIFQLPDVLYCTLHRENAWILIRGKFGYDSTNL